MTKKAKKTTQVKLKMRHSSSSLSERMPPIRDALQTVETGGWIDLVVGPLHLIANVTQFSHFNIFGYTVTIFKLCNTKDPCLDLLNNAK